MAETGALSVKIVTKRGLSWQGAAQYVQVPVEDGSLGILPHRQPLLARLKEGAVILTIGDDTKTFPVAGGFVSVDSDVVTVVAEGMES